MEERWERCGSGVREESDSIFTDEFQIGVEDLSKAKSLGVSFRAEKEIRYYVRA